MRYKFCRATILTAREMRLRETRNIKSLMIMVSKPSSSSNQMTNTPQLNIMMRWSRTKHNIQLPTLSKKWILPIDCSSVITKGYLLNYNNYRNLKISRQWVWINLCKMMSRYNLISNSASIASIIIMSCNNILSNYWGSPKDSKNGVSNSLQTFYSIYSRKVSKSSCMGSVTGS